MITAGAARTYQPPCGPHDDLVPSKMACELAGVTYRQLDYWCRSGVIIPAAVVGGDGGPTHCERGWPGSGRHRRFTGRQVTILAACGVLARLCADTAALQALVTACETIDLPAVVAIDVGGRAHVDRIPAGGCWLVPVGAIS